MAVTTCFIGCHQHHHLLAADPPGVKWRPLARFPRQVPDPPGSLIEASDRGRAAPGGHPRWLHFHSGSPSVRESKQPEAPGPSPLCRLTSNPLNNSGTHLSPRDHEAGWTAATCVCFSGPNPETSTPRPGSYGAASGPPKSPQRFAAADGRSHTKPKPRHPCLSRFSPSASLTHPRPTPRPFLLFASSPANKPAGLCLSPSFAPPAATPSLLPFPSLCSKLFGFVGEERSLAFTAALSLLIQPASLPSPTQNRNRYREQTRRSRQSNPA